MKIINTIILLLLVQISLSQVKPNKTWTEHTTFQGIKIEYKFAECNPDEGRKQILVLFRYTNTTQDKVELTWKAEKWRNNICVNCNSNSSEYNRFLILNSNEVIEANGSSKKIKSNYIFSNFSILVPGMKNQQLTDFKFQNLAKKIL
jgi:hypothetical protein